MRDADVRASVLKLLAERHAGDDNTRIVEEMGIWSGTARIDVAVINGELTGYEIKSDRDTLHRLPIQQELYSRVFDRVVLVVGSKHVDAARESVPRWWGITVAKPGLFGVTLVPRRSPKLNRRVDTYLLAKLLWRDEALTVLDSLQLAKGWRTKSVDAIHRRLASEVEFSQLSARVRQALKERNDWLRQASSNER